MHYVKTGDEWQDEELGADFKAVRNELLVLFGHFELLDTLYAKDSSIVDELNAAAPTFFSQFQGILWDWLFLSVARLFDSRGRPGRERLTLERVLDEFVGGPGCSDVEKATQLFREANQAADKLVSIRNARIAHLDRTHAMKPAAKPLPKVTLGEFRAVLQAIIVFMNHIQGEIKDSQVAYDWGGINRAPSEILAMARKSVKLRGLESQVRKKELSSDDLFEAVRRRP
ncbi:MAG: hypothetical protein AAF823_16295 [Planctomycetota bacterium]